MTSPMPKPFHCPDCGKEFSKEKKLINHFKVHSTEKSYKCEICKITVSQRTLYKKHIKTHFEKGKYPCPDCGRVFIKLSWLKKHMTSQCEETTQSENKYICKDCGRPYESLPGVRSHLLKGKHAHPVFTCHACMWSCTSSKALFIHVLQHGNADVTVVGLTQEKRFEHYSTSKIRAKVDKYKQNSQAATAVKKTKTPEIIKFDEHILQTESPQSQNILTNEIATQNNVTTSKEDYILQNDNFCQHPPIVSAETVEERLNYILSEAKNAQTTILQQEKMQNFTPIPHNECVESIFQSRRQDLDKNTNQSKIALTEENVACGSLSASEKTIQSEDRIPKKMPKLVSLYPEEETILNDGTCTIANNNLLMQNEITLPHGMLHNGFSPETTTIMHNDAVIPYGPTPMVNTMFFPPLFLVQNNLPVNQEIRPQNQFQMGETIIENQEMFDKTADIRRAQDFRTMASAMMLPRKKKKRQTRVGKRFPGQIKQASQDVFPEKVSVQNSKKNIKKIPRHNITATEDGQTMINTSSTSIRGEQDPKTTTVHNEKQIENTTNWLMNENLNQYNSEDIEQRKLSENNFWETLIGGDDSNKRIMHSSSGGNTNQLNLRGKFQNSHLSDFHDDTITTTLDRPEENIPKKTIDSATVKHQPHGPIGGIDVEDYIKKFMWF